MPRWRAQNQAITAASLLLLQLWLSQAAASTLNTDGLHEESWFLQSFLELNEDWQTATQADKHFALIWELKGCPVCERLHSEILSRPQFAEEISANFDVLQLNIIGSRWVTDFDSTRIEEKSLASVFDIRGTPTVQVFAADAAPGNPPREIIRIRGLPDTQRFMRMLRYASSGAYRQQTFEQYIATFGNAPKHKNGSSAL